MKPPSDRGPTHAHPHTPPHTAPHGSNTGKTWAMAGTALIGLAGLIAIPVWLEWVPADTNDEPFSVVRSAGASHDVVINNDERTPAVLFRIADELCGDNAVCDIRYWPNADAVPAVAERISHGEDALYARNRTDGIDMIFQNGREFRR